MALTQGKWYVGNIFPLPTIYVDGKRICTVSKDLPIDERESNAEAIALVPEMIKVLSDVKEWLEIQDKVKNRTHIRLIDSVLNKAVTV